MAPDQRFTDPEDEDLFDFPPVDQALSGDLDASAATGPSIELDEIDIDELAPILEESVAAPDPIFDAESAGTPDPVLDAGPPSLASSAPTKPTAGPVDLGPANPENLDEDLFDFDASFLVQLSKDLNGGSAPNQTPTAQAAQSAQGTTAPAAEATPAKAQPEPPAQPKAPAQAQPAQSRRPAPAVELEGGQDVFDMTVPVGPSGTLVPMGHEEGPRSRVVELLAIGFIIMNTGILLLAWRAGSQFQNTLLQVTQTLGNGSNGQPAAVPTRPVIDNPVVLVPATEPRPIPEPKPVQEAAKVEDPLTIDSLPRITLQAAEALLDEGQFDSARQRVFHLLANRDRYALTDELVTESEVLIARATQLQGRALTEVGR